MPTVYCPFTGDCRSDCVFYCEIVKDNKWYPACKLAEACKKIMFEGGAKNANKQTD